MKWCPCKRCHKNCCKIEFCIGCNQGFCLSCKWQIHDNRHASAASATANRILRADGWHTHDSCTCNWWTYKKTYISYLCLVMLTTERAKISYAGCARALIDVFTHSCTRTCEMKCSVLGRGIVPQRRWCVLGGMSNKQEKQTWEQIVTL